VASLDERPPAGWYTDPAGDHDLRYWDGNSWTTHVHGGATALGGPVGGQAEPAKPAPRLLRSFVDAEEVAAEWMRYWGFADARCTPIGTDGGLDVVSASAVAQVKMHAKPIGRPLVQNLFGAARGKKAVFFALAGYTLEAKAWAEDVDMALFRFDRQGEPEAVNDAAASMAKQPSPSSWVARSTAALCYRILCTDQRAAQVIDGQRKGVVRKERLVGIRQSWVALEQIAIAYTTSWRKTLRQSRRMVAFETISGKPFLPPQLGADLVHQAPDGIRHIEPLYEPHEFIDSMYGLWNQYFELRQEAARQRCAGQLGARGIPVKDARSLHLTPCEPLMLPVFVGLLAHNGGERIVVVEGAGGSLSDQLSEVFTHHLGYLRTQLSGARAISVD
jgi:hypothetical protein